MEELRTISIDKLHIVDQGASSVLYDWNEHQVLKVFEPNLSFVYIEREYEKANMAVLSGIKTPKVYEIVKTGNSFGIIMDKIDGRSLLNYLVEHKTEIPKQIATFATFVKKSHNVTFKENDLLSAEDEMLEQLNNRELLGITKEEQTKMKEIIASIPKSDCFSHGDCHLGNVMLCGSEWLFIDIGRMTKGNPMIDMISMFCQFRMPTYSSHIDQRISPNAMLFTEEERKEIWDIYLQTIEETNNEEKLFQIEKKLNVIASIRMLLIKYYNPKFFSEDLFQHFIKNAVDYYDENMGGIL